MIRAKSDLLRQHVKREVLTESLLDEFRDPTQLPCGQSAGGWYRDCLADRGVPAQQVNGEQLSRGLCVELAGRCGVLKLAPQGETDLRQHRITEWHAVHHRDACRVVAPQLLGGAREQLSAEVQMEGTGAGARDILPAQLSGGTPTNAQGKVAIVDRVC